MDNLTHSLVGALIGQAGLKRKTGLAMPALIIGANLPDIDAACIVYGVESLSMRRGITHGPIAWMLLPLLLAGVLWWFDRWQERRGTRPEGRLPVRFGWLYAMALIACLTHPALDWLNVYGIRLLEPFSDGWFYGDTLFIIDVWLWALLGFATWFSLRREKRGKSWRWPAVTAIVLSLVYIGCNFVVTHATTAVYAINGKSAASIEELPNVPRFALLASPIAIRPWRRQVIAGDRNLFFIGDPALNPAPANMRSVTEEPCVWPDTKPLRRTNSDLDAFLFWARAPFVERHPNGRGIVFQDARFYNRSGGSPFSVAFPDVECRSLPKE